jgi:hypothetical protein
MVAAALLSGSLGCLKTAHYSPVRVSTAQDPDALYAAAVRVFVRRGWGLQARDPNARVVETEWVETQSFVDASYRVIINQGQLELFTSCRRRDGFNRVMARCDDGNERPVGYTEREQELARDIVAETATVAAPRTAAPVPTSSGRGAGECVKTCGQDRTACSKGCKAKSDACQKGCSDGYIACVGACSRG